MPDQVFASSGRPRLEAIPPAIAKLHRNLSLQLKLAMEISDEHIGSLVDIILRGITYRSLKPQPSRRAWRAFVLFIVHRCACPQTGAVTEAQEPLARMAARPGGENPPVEVEIQ